MAVTLATTAARRLSLGYNGTGSGECGYNGQPYDPILNPGGMDGNGVAVNWVNMCADLVTLGIITAAQADLAASAADRQQAWGPVWSANMGTVSYVSPTRCTVDTTGTDLTVGTHVQADCGADGYKFGLVSGSSEAAGVTTVDFSWFGGGALTSNLKSITTIDDSRLVYVVDLETPVAAAAASAATAAAAKTDALAAQAATAALAADAEAAVAALGVISLTTTIYVATTGSDTTGDGSSGAPYASISQALYSIRNKRFLFGVTAAIRLAGGEYTIADTIVIDHPDADKIQIIGNTSAETLVAIAAIDTTAKTITVAGDYTGSIQAGDIVGLTGSSTSGLNGAYTVSGASYSGGNTVLTCAAETFASATVGGGSVFIMPRNRVKLVLASSMVGFSIKRRFGGLSGFRIDGSGRIGILCDYPLRVESISQMLFCGFDTAIYISNGGVAFIDSIASKNCSKMVYASGGRVFTQTGIFICDAADFMFLVDSMGFGDATAGTKYARGIAVAQYSPDNTTGNYNAYLVR